METELERGIREAVQAAGQMMRSGRERARVYEKGSWGDVVTNIDLAIQDMLKERLLPLLPGSRFLGEEKGERADPSEGDLSLIHI